MTTITSKYRDLKRACYYARRPCVGWAVSPNHDGPLRDRATRRLKVKGKGDTYFTEREYDIGFLKKSGDGLEKARPQTAAELLGGPDGEDDEDDRPARRRRK